MTKVSGEGSGWDPIQPTSELAALALTRLLEGDTGKVFTDITSHLTCCAHEPNAMTEGTLLFAGADIHATSEGLVSAITERDASKQKPTNMVRIVSQLDWVEMGARSRGLRPIGHKILEHCIGLSINEEVTDKLQHIKFLADEAAE